MKAAWLRFPSFQLETLVQVYRRIDESTYRYKSGGGRFIADLEVDELGLVKKMIDRLLFILTFCSALGCGLVAGIFFAFSAFVMKALARLPPAQGTAAMQSINVAVLNPWFFAAFFGTAAACVLLAIFSLLRWDKPGAVYLLVGSLLYLLGTLQVTIVFNVPRNEALAAIDPASTSAASLWSSYIVSWTAWNHVRTIAALAAAASLTIALCLLRDG